MTQMAQRDTAQARNRRGAHRRAAGKQGALQIHIHGLAAGRKSHGGGRSRGSAGRVWRCAHREHWPHCEVVQGPLRRLVGQLLFQPGRHPVLHAGTAQRVAGRAKGRPDERREANRGRAGRAKKELRHAACTYAGMHRTNGPAAVVSSAGEYAMAVVALTWCMKRMDCAEHFWPLQA
jgi:hypothetical protein